MGAHDEGRGPALGARALTRPLNEQQPLHEQQPLLALGGPGPTGRRRLSPSRSPSPSQARPPEPGRVLVQVLPDVSGIDRVFDYVMPARLGPPAIGTVVRVPLGGRRVRGWLVGLPARPPEGVDLREVAAVVSRGPSPEVVDLCRWAAWRWAGPLRPFLHAASGLRDKDTARTEGTASPGRVAGQDRSLAAAPVPSGLVERALVQERAVVRYPSVPRTALVNEVARRVGPGRGVLVLVPTQAGAESLALATARPAVVVGTRSAAFSRVADLGAVLVLDAHDDSLVETRAPTWSAWVVAAERARRAGVPCILESRCPTVEQLAWGTLIEGPRAAEQAEWPAVEVIDSRGEDPRSARYPSRLASLIRGAHQVSAGRPAIVVLNRTGEARLLACASCGELIRCETCAGAVERRPPAHPGEPTRLACRRCGTSRPAVCAACGSMRLAALRVGASRAAEEVEALTGLRTVEVTARTRLDWPAMRDVPVLVGTEAVLRRARSASVVAFLDFDSELLAPRMRAAEQAMALIALAGSLVGGRSTGGTVAVQTRQPGQGVIRAAQLGRPELVADAEAERRRLLGLPPHTAVARIDGRLAGEMADRLRELGLEVVETRPGSFLARACDHDLLCGALASARPAAVGVRVEVDPIDL